MRILFLTDNYPPEVNAPASRTFEHAVRWSRAGAEVTIITCAPNFPQGRVYPGYRNRVYASETIDGVRVIRVWSYIAPNAGMARRIADYVSFAATAFVAGLFVKTDVIVATSPQFFTTWAGAALSIVKRRPWVFELRDIWPESIAAVGAGVGSRALRFLEKVELWLYRHAARVLAVTPAFRDNLTGRGIDPAKVEVVTGGADLTLWSPRQASVTLRASWGATDKFVIGYVGTFGMAHGLDFIVRAASNLALVENHVHLVLVGDGGERAAIERQLADGTARNVTLLAPIAKGEVVDLLASVDAALVPLRRADTFLSVIPSKIFEAAALRRPILLGVEGQAKAIVDEFGAGVCFTPEDEQSFVAAVLRLVNDRQLYVRCQDGGTALATAYDRDALAAHMLDILTDVARQHR